ncbi:hypothetical protein JCM8547_009177 [Rhodosporidiobolus lusitaniae]
MSDAEAPTRTDILKQAFGEHAKAFEENLDAQAKAHFSAYEYKIKQQRPVYDQRAQLAKKVPHFWPTSLQNCRQVAQFIDPVDEDAFKHLTGVDIVHGDKDVRDYEVRFTFSKNPYFSSTSPLVASFTVTPPSSLKPAPEPVSSFDLEAPSYILPSSSSSAIKWTSPEHDLTKKAPRPKVDVEDLEENDEYDGPGSFFNLFKDEGEDKMSIGESLLEWWGHASEYAAGLASLDDISDNEGAGGLDFDFDEFNSEDESEDEDPKKEIDLGSDEEEKRPKKKQRNKK